MNFELWNLRAFLFGSLAGTICVGGLALGISLLFSAQKGENLSDTQKSRKKLFGGLLLVGQFIGAVAVLAYYLKTSPKIEALPLAFGLVASVFIGNFLIAAMRKY